MPHQARGFAAIERPRAALRGSAWSAAIATLAIAVWMGASLGPAPGHDDGPSKECSICHAGHQSVVTAASAASLTPASGRLSSARPTNVSDELHRPVLPHDPRAPPA